MKFVEERSSPIEVKRLIPASAEFWILGTTPLVMNRLAEKAKQELLFQKGKKTAADKATHMKHDPMAEFRSSLHMVEEGPEPRLFFPGAGIKAAMGTAAIETAGSISKAALFRLLWVEGDPQIYGVPKVMMSIVRTAGMQRTPDIRTRAVLPRWCAKLNISFVQPKLRSAVVGNLLANAGVLVGIGDWRQEKGAGTYGQFNVVGEDDPDVRRLVAEEGWLAQEAAIETPEPRVEDKDTRDLWHWFHGELYERQRVAEAAEEERAARAARKRRIS